MCQINLNFSKKSFGRILNFGKIIINCDENRITVPYIGKPGKFKDSINDYLEKLEEEQPK
ncbi:MAG: hypothetical protein ACTTIV_02935 [Campylobacter sp.]